MDVQLFLRALSKRWWALLSSAVLTILGLYALATGKTSSWVVWTSLGAAVSMLLLASALAWNDEHRRSLVLESEVEKLKLVPAQLTITPYELRSSDSMAAEGRDIFLRAQIELETPVEIEILGYSVELSLQGLIEAPEVRSVDGKWRMHDRTSDIPHSAPLPPLPLSLRSGHPAEGWIHFLTPRSQYELESSRITLVAHTPRGDGNVQFRPVRGYWLSSGQNFIAPDFGN